MKYVTIYKGKNEYGVYFMETSEFDDETAAKNYMKFLKQHKKKGEKVSWKKIK